jgi:transcriptional regulator with XRE-family HTH domain
MSAMAEPRVAPALGPRLRAERTRRGLTVRGLAQEVGVSASLISQIETGKSQPSVSTLYAITASLDMPLEELFGSESAASDGPAPRPETDEIPVDLPGAAATAYLGADRSRALGPHASPGDQELISLDSGVTWRRLGQVPDHHVDFLLVTYAPGGASSANGELMRHAGTEYGYLVSGELELTLGFDEHHLEPGDAVCFESSTPHRYRNDGVVPAVGVWFVADAG